MKLAMWQKVIAVLVVGLFAQLSLADDPIAEVAGVVKEVNHFPNDEQRSTLLRIARDSGNSESLRAIAMAAHDIEHAVPDEHKATLQEITEDEAATEQERELASILVDFNHTVADEDREKLEAMQ